MHANIYSKHKHISKEKVYVEIINPKHSSIYRHFKPCLQDRLTILDAQRETQGENKTKTTREGYGLS